MEQTPSYNTGGRTGRKLCATVTLLLAIIALAGVDPTFVFAHFGKANDPAATASATPFYVLSASDKAHYREAARLQLAGKSEEVEAQLNTVHDPLLVNDIYALTAPDSAQDQSASRSKPYEVRHTQTVLHDGMGGHWDAGLLAYRQGNMPAAAQHFSALFAHADNFDSEDRATVAFWAYRAFLAAGDKVSAAYYVKQASKEQPGFYSILASHAISENAWLQEGSSLGVQQVLPLAERDEIRRVFALKEIGQDKAAESALYNAFVSSDTKDHEGILTLATLLNLPAAHMRMMLADAYETVAENRGPYPMPHWTPSSGYHVDPALLFAIMRQESGFNPHAVSAGGAIGVMQLMPQTADAMARSAHLRGLSSAVPEVNMALGQMYLRRLMETPEVGNNLVFLTAAYNAGPVAVAHWRHNVHYADDALLFIESIPYHQTRDYVVNVLGNYWIYGQLLGGSSDPSITALSHGQWPHYAGLNAPVAKLSLINQTVD